MRALSALVYLAAWLMVGTFFVTCAYFADSAQSWRREGRGVAGFLYTYALALPGGFAIQMSAAVLLRLITRAMGLRGIIPWLCLGGALGVAVPWTFARAGYLLEGLRFAHEWQAAKTAMMFPLMGAMMYEMHPVWTQIAVGAASAVTVRLMLGVNAGARPASPGAARSRARSRTR